MHLAGPRFTVRRLVLVVALAGLAMGAGLCGYGMWRLSDYFAARALKHRNIEMIMRDSAARFKRQADHQASLARKDERAARYPWLALEPYPPEP
jgi:hypothetical protein